MAKEFLHLRDWLDRAAVIVSRCEDAYAADPPTPNASLKRPSTGGAHPAALANLEKRAEVLADGVLSLDEADDLQGLATIQGLAASDVAATHRVFVLAWAHLAPT